MWRGVVCGVVGECGVGCGEWCDVGCGMGCGVGWCVEEGVMG